MTDNTDHDRVRFLDNEIDLCHTFLDLARVDADDLEACVTAKANAHRGYETALSFLGSVRDADERMRLTGKLSHLKERLQDVSPDCPKSL